MCRRGGSRRAGTPRPLTRCPARPIWVDAFVIRRDQVTFGQYLAFLNALGQAAAPWVPWRDTSGDQRALRWAHDGWRADTARSPDEPVVLLLPAYAAAFAAWRSEQDCKTWRLPHEIEWERAARGADQRHYPWGMGFDPCFSNVFSSVEGPPRAVAVGSFPVDTSPYGVRDLGGNTRDHCANGYADVPQGNILDPRAPPDPVLQIGRGGAWLSRASNARCAGRFVQAEKPTGAVSFRLARSLFEPGQIGV
jgi:formylglycine-generating enzyme required for sulfatase activity